MGSIFSSAGTEKPGDKRPAQDESESKSATVSDAPASSTSTSSTSSASPSTLASTATSALKRQRTSFVVASHAQGRKVGGERTLSPVRHLSTFNDILSANCASQLVAVGKQTGIGAVDIAELLEASGDRIEHWSYGELKVFRWMSGDTEVGGCCQGAVCGTCCVGLVALDEDTTPANEKCACRGGGCGAVKTVAAWRATGGYKRCASRLDTGCVCSYGLCAACCSKVQVEISDGEFGAVGEGHTEPPGGWKAIAAELQKRLGRGGDA